MSRRNMPLALIVMPEGTSDAGLVASLVADLGFEARHHQDAGSALEAVEYDHPALVVHGWGLPDMDAVTFHGAVRQRAGGASIPTLAIAPDRESAERVAGAASAGEVMVRPLLRKEVALRLERLVAGAGAEMAMPVRQEPVIEEPARRKPARRPQKQPVAEQLVSESRPDAGASGLRLHVIGLGEWGIRGAELFDRQGVPARGVDWAAGVDRSSLPEGRRHRVAAAGDHAAASRAIAADPSLSEALRADADAELFVVIANLGAGAGSLSATLLARIADLAPRAGRLVVARLPGLRSDPEDRALALVALNSILYGPATGIFLVQPADVPETDADATAPLRRLLELWAMSAGAGPEPIQTLSASGLGRLLAVPGFLGWRETTLTADDIAPDGRGWHELVKATPWQPPGFAWSEAQGAIPVARFPWAWHDTGGRHQFERFVQAAWDEAAPCALVPALYAADPAFAVLVSAGMPYPHGLLTLRDSVEADRALLAEKRRKAQAPIPLGEDFLPSGLDMLVAPVPARRPPEPAPEPEPWRAPAPEAAWAPEPEHAVEAWPEAPAAVEIPELAAGPMPAAYESALGLVRRIFSAEDLGAEVDLGEVRYVLYDLLEVLREEPHAILPEVFRPEPEEWFERHHVNVAVLAILTGDVLKGSLSEVIDIGTAALLHDIGMLPTRETWDADVKLPPAVFEQVIRPHPDTGFQRLQEIPKMTGAIARMVLQEHERMEGSGFPEGLAGDAIDIGARILAVCDTLEALSHPRPYRDHLSPGDALARTQMLSQHTLYPMVVNALCGELTGLLRRGAREPERR